MSDYLEHFRKQTRWSEILGSEDAFRLLCADSDCSLSCANLKNGKISVTSMHGATRHSYELSKRDMAFAMFIFLNSLTEKEASNFCKAFNKVSPRLILELEHLE